MTSSCGGDLRPGNGSQHNECKEAHLACRLKGHCHGAGRQDQQRRRRGKVKEATGKATDNESLEAEGKGDQAAANVKQAGEKVKDAVKEAVN